MTNDQITKAVAEAYKKMKQEELKGDQHKIDANKNGQIDAHDFKLLRGQKNEETELEPGQGSHLNLGGARVKNTRSAVLAHVKKTFPNAKDIKKTQYGWGPKHNSVDEAMEETEPKTEKEKNLAALGHPKDKITHKDVLIGRGVIKKEEWDSKKPTVSEAEELNEDLRNWFKPDHPEGGWKRINSKGEAIGPCAREPGEPKPKCMSNEKRASLTKQERAAAVAAKRRHDPNPERKGAPINVSNFGKGKISESVEYIEEKNAPTNPELWSRAKALAKQKFDVYPSAYANGWAAKWYKSKGGGWKSVSEEVELDEMDNQIHHPGTKVKVPHRGKMVSGKVVRHDKGDKYGSPFYVVDVGEYESTKVPAHNVTKEEVELTEGNDDVGEMIKDKLKIIINRAKEMHDGIGPNTDMPEWVKSKITLAQDYVSTACDYSCGSEQLGEELELNEKAVSTSQQKFMGIVHAVQKGEMKAPSPEIAKAAAGMTKKAVKDYASTKHAGLPTRVIKDEVENIDEISKSTLGSYIKAASHDVATKSALTRAFADKSAAEKEKENFMQARKDDEKSNKMFDKSWKRRQGIAKAADRLAKEEIDQLQEVGYVHIPSDYGRGDRIDTNMPREPSSKGIEMFPKPDPHQGRPGVIHMQQKRDALMSPSEKARETAVLKRLNQEEREISEDMGEPDIKVRQTYTKAYADHYKRAMRLNPKGASRKAEVMAYDTVKMKHGDDAHDTLKAYHDKNQNESYEQIDEELSSRAKLVKELYNKAKEMKKSKKDVFEADPEMEIMPSPQYSQPKK